jgi:hypothetical protein
MMGEMTTISYVFFRMTDLRFWQSHCWRLKPPGIWRCVVGRILYGFPKHCNAFFFTVKQFKKTYWPRRLRQYDIRRQHKLLSQRHDVTSQKTSVFVTEQLFFLITVFKKGDWSVTVLGAATRVCKLTSQLSSYSFSVILPYRPTRIKYINPSLYAGSFFAFMQIRGVAPKIKIHHSDHSAVKSIKIFRQHLTRPSSHTAWCSRSSGGGGGGGSSSHHNVSAKKRITQKWQKFFFGRGEEVGYSRIFVFRDLGGGGVVLGT